MKTTLVRLSCIFVALAATTFGLRADLTNVPPDLGPAAVPVITNPPITPITTTATTTTNASPAKVKKPAKAKPVKLPGAFAGTVASINTNAMTLTLEGPAPARVLAMSSQSRLFHKTSPLTLSQVKVGDHVRGQAKKNAKGPDIILNAYFSDKAPASTPPKKKAVKKETTGAVK